MNPYVNSMNGFGGGFIAFWPSVSEVIAPSDVSPGPGGDPGYDIRRQDYLREEARRQAILRDDQEIMELVAMLAASGVFDELD